MFRIYFFAVFPCSTALLALGSSVNEEHEAEACHARDVGEVHVVELEHFVECDDVLLWEVLRAVHDLAHAVRTMVDGTADLVLFEQENTCC